MKTRILAIPLAAALIVTGTLGLASSPSPAEAAATEIIVDNAHATTTGSWTTSTFKKNYFGANYATTPKAATATATIRWTPDVVDPGVYGVYYWLPDGGNDRAWDIPIKVHDELGDVGYSIDATPAVGGQWIHLGDHSFTAGTAGYVELTNKAGAVVVADAIKLGAPIGLLDYTIRPDIEKQKILGIGVEIQSDSIGSGNNGLPDDSPAYVPGDLIPSERQRLYDEMLTGFRYVRLAMGLYLRGVTPDGKNIVERYEGQMDDLKELIEESGIEGADVEYWSPAPYWKDNDNLIRGSLDLVHIEDEAERDAWVDEYSDAMMQDIEYLEANGVPVKQWSLQNEPTALTGYSSIYIDHEEYFDVFKTMAAKIKAHDPDIFIHGDSHHGQYGQGSELIRNDQGETDAEGNVVRRPALDYLDGWSHHRNWNTSDDLIRDRVSLNANTGGKAVFNSEWEFLDGKTSETRMIETAQSIMNWMTFMDAPTWYWLHALKPTYNEEAVGYGLGLWRPSDDAIEPGDPHADIAPQHWKAIPTNWHGVAPFVQHLPWDSTRLQVDERVTRTSQRIMAWESPEGELGLALTNRSDSPFRFNIDLGSNQTISGHRYDKTVEDQLLGEKSGQIVQVVVPPKTIEIWSADAGDTAPVLASSTLTAEQGSLEPGDTTVTTLTGTLSDGTAADLATGTVAYSSSAPTVATVDSDGLVTAVGAGSAEITASVTLGGVTVTTAPLVVTVTAPVLAKGVPGIPQVSDDAGHRTGLNDGNFTVTTNMWWGDNASSFTLLENGVPIHTEALTDATPLAQVVRVPIANKPNGTYTYVAELSNAFGSRSSAPRVIEVEDANPGVPALSHDNWDRNGAFTVTADLWWGTNATSYRVYENDVVVAEGPLTASSPAAQRARFAASDRAAGDWRYRFELVNASGVTSSAPLVVHVDG
ncbi:chitinase N-terminal domain-containing protein [Agromyces aureus]|uniref:BIG2 domain-containing protein n=1 Tax=Agromyces aureus TaxID=453304 RepID=A0A191WI07_9MICO|nr:chitinase N-terminal domain-containing protein [Agromyces aureus]ANJ27808.1 hypothetical protein ATC03_14905 [Agromyces aureus]